MTIDWSILIKTRNDSLSDLERNYRSCSEEIVLTKQRGIGFGAFLSLGMQLQQQKWPKYFAYVEILCRVVQTDIFVRLHELSANQSSKIDCSYSKMLMSLNDTHLNFHVILSIVIWCVARDMEFKLQV